MSTGHLARGEASALGLARGRTGWLTGRLVFRLMTLAAMLIFVMGVVFLYGIKADADRLRSIENYFNSSDVYASRLGPPLSGGYSLAQLASAKAALAGPRGDICRALGFCDGLTL
jgi:hypothetical protein